MYVHVHQSFTDTDLHADLHGRHVGEGHLARRQLPQNDRVRPHVGRLDVHVVTTSLQCYNTVHRTSATTAAPTIARSLAPQSNAAKLKTLHVHE